MKKLLYLICIISINTSCTTTGRVSHLNSSELSLMVDGYYYYYGEYPPSLNCFLDFYKDQDSINTTIKYFSERKHDITWTLNNKSVLEEELLIKEKEDTLLWFSEKKHFSYLDDLIDGYEIDYLEYPKSLKDLIDYDKATRELKEESFDRCIVATLRYLEKFKDQLTWRNSDSLFLLMTGNDTISCRIGPSYGVSICESDNWRKKSVFLFFDNNGTAVFNNDLVASFKTGLQEIRKNYKNNHFDVSDYHIIQFTSIEGIMLYCKDDDLVLDTEWFKDVSGYLRQFTTEHELGKVIFVSAPYRKQ